MIMAPSMPVKTAVTAVAVTLQLNALVRVLLCVSIVCPLLPNRFTYYGHISLNSSIFRGRASYKYIMLYDMVLL